MIFDIFKPLFFVIFAFLPLGIWKLIDIIIWLIK